MPTPTNQQMNIYACTFTPTGGAATPILGVQSVSFDENGDVLSEGSDGDLFDTVSGVVKLAPMVTLTLNRGMLGLATLTAGVAGTLVFTVGDFRNAAVAAGGGKIFTVANAILNPRKFDAQHRNTVKQTLPFSTFSSDGQTNPVGIAAA